MGKDLIFASVLVFILILGSLLVSLWLGRKEKQNKQLEELKKEKMIFLREGKIKAGHWDQS